MTVANQSLDFANLSRIVRAVDPSARLVPARLVRRVIRWQYGLSSGASISHRVCFELSRSELLSLVDASDLGETAESLPERVLLLPLPDEDEASPGRVVNNLWRTLFHASVDRAVDRKPGAGFHEDRALFNATILHEIRTVLSGEHRLPPPEDARIVFREFAAFFLEMIYFAPAQVEVYFPGFYHPEEVVGFLEERIDAKALFDASRPEGASQPGLVVHEERKSEPESAVPASIADHPSLEARAAAIAEKGNDVRAAILDRRLGRVTEAEGRLQHLAERLRTPLNLSGAAVVEWYAALRPLLEPASRGFWPVEGRLLFELQTACLDVERKVYAVELVEWAVTFGKQPVKRLLEKPRQVNVLRRLRRALKNATRVSVSIEQREALLHLLHDAIEGLESRVRQNNRPILAEVLDEVGLIPVNLPERIARGKLIEELLDTLCSRGFLKMSDLRDAIARNRLKLDDLSGPREFLAGDPILQANRKLALRMDGIYRRGEIYLRALQRLTSLAFGTVPGRLLTKFVALPFGGAYVILEGMHHFVEKMEDLTRLIIGHRAPSAANEAAQVAGNAVAAVVADPDLGHSLWSAPITIVMAGLFLLGLIHFSAFRRQVGKAARIAFLDVPSAIFHSPFIHGLFDNRLTRAVGRYLLTPLAIGCVVGLVMRLLGIGWESTVFVAGGTALLAGTLFRTPIGRGLGERFDECLARLWRIISVNFVFGALMLIVQFFTAFFELIERGMYAVDEWLRFHEGQSAASFAFKLIFGTAWFFFAYAFRFAWNLLIEPQINPIKHFPVVTVSHKLLLPMVPSLAKSLELSLPTTTTIVFGIPGIFGFLVWECKENWKLYKANRAHVIGAIAVGSHGERVRSLLRPGFHSGVVPKQFAKLRNAESTGHHKKAAKFHHHIEHVAQAIHHLAERQLVAYLKASRRWGGLPIRIGKIHLSTNRLRIVLAIQHWEQTVVLSIEERGGWLIGFIEEPGWLDRLSENQVSAFTDVVTALYKLSGVHILREQAAAILRIDPYRVDCRPAGLIVLPKGDAGTVFLDYGDAPTIEATGPIDGRAVAPIAVGDLVLSECPVAWQKWLDRWEADQAGKAPIESILNHPVR